MRNCVLSHCTGGLAATRFNLQSPQLIWKELFVATASIQMTSWFINLNRVTLYNTPVLQAYPQQSQPSEHHGRHPQRHVAHAACGNSAFPKKGPVPLHAMHPPSARAGSLPEELSGEPTWCDLHEQPTIDIRLSTDCSCQTVNILKAERATLKALGHSEDTMVAVQPCLHSTFENMVCRFMYFTL